MKKAKEKMLVSLDAMSEEKSKKLYNLARKIMKFAKDNEIAQLCFTYFGVECKIGTSDMDYIRTNAGDKVSNPLYDVTVWR